MNALEKLAREIWRVSLRLADYEQLDGTPQVNVKPALFMLNAALENACKAAGSNDAVTVLQALEDLKGFEK